MFKAWSNWWAGEEFQRQSTGNQRQNTKRDVSHGLCESIRGAKGLWPSRLSPQRKCSKIPYSSGSLDPSFQKTVRLSAAILGCNPTPLWLLSQVLSQNLKRSGFLCPIPVHFHDGASRNMVTKDCFDGFLSVWLAHFISDGA